MGKSKFIDEAAELSLARQAVAIDDSPQTRSYLLSDLLRAPAATGIMHPYMDVSELGL